MRELRLVPRRERRFGRVLDRLGPGQPDQRLDRRQEARFDALQVVTTLQDDTDPAEGALVGDRLDPLRHRAEALRAERHAGERVARVCVEAGGDEHELRSVLLEDREHHPIERRGVGAIRPG